MEIGFGLDKFLILADWRRMPTEMRLRTPTDIIGPWKRKRIHNNILFRLFIRVFFYGSSKTQDVSTICCSGSRSFFLSSVASCVTGQCIGMSESLGTQRAAERLFTWVQFHVRLQVTTSYERHLTHRAGKWLHPRMNPMIYIQGTVNDSDMDSVTLKAYKVKDCGWNLWSDDCIWNAKRFFLASSA